MYLRCIFCTRDLKLLMNLHRVLPILALSVVAALPAGAATISFTNRNDFLAALQSYSEQTFSSIPDGSLGTNTLALQGGPIQYDIQSNYGLWGITIGGDRSLSTNTSPAYLLVSNFTAPVYAIGGYFFFDDDYQAVDPPSAGTVTVDNGVDPLTVGNIQPATTTTRFFGVISDTPIVSLKFQNTTGNGFINIDNLILADGVPQMSDIPEPSTYGMLSTAGILGAWLRKRRKQS